MIREILVLIFVSILLAGCITSQPSEKGTLQLTSSPTGAEIYLDNQYSGSTPSTIYEVVPGNHTLEFRSNGYKSWKTAITVPSGTSNYFAALTAQPGSVQQVEISPVATELPAVVTVRVSREQMVVGDSNTFSGTATGTGSVTLTIFGPGYYANGLVLDSQVKPDSLDDWSYLWNPGTKIQSGTYTIVVSDAGKTVSDRAGFTVIGNGIVTVSSTRYSVLPGEFLTFSGMCTTGARNVQLTLSGPGRFSTGVDLGTNSLTADNTWSYRYTVDNAAPAGVYTIYVNDVPKTTSGSSQFTVHYDE
jgi:hypothetical protein